MKTKHVLAAASALAMLASVTSAQAADKCGVVDISGIIAIKPSSGTDNDVNVALTGLASSWATAQGDSNKETGEALAAMEDPKMKLLGAAVMAAGGSLKAMAAAFTALPEVIDTIESSRDDADDLYIGLNSERGNDGAFWPRPNDQSDVAIRGAPVAMPGLEGMVPYVLGLSKNQQTISINLFDHDTGSRDDHLGSVTFSLGDLGKGPLKTLMISDKHGGVVYGFEYEVVPVPCDFPTASNMRAAQNKEHNTEKGSAEQVKAFQLVGVPVLIPSFIKAGVL